jgi:hypothetical protein
LCTESNGDSYEDSDTCTQLEKGLILTGNNFGNAFHEMYAFHEMSGQIPRFWPLRISCFGTENQTADPVFLTGPGIALIARLLNAPSIGILQVAIIVIVLDLKVDYI